MIPRHAGPWQENGARGATRAQTPGRFIRQHVAPLFYRNSEGGSKERDCTEIISEEHFWGEGGDVVFGAVRLNGFRLTDWFPRAPDVFCSQHAHRARQEVWSGEFNTDYELGEYFSPQSKRNLIEEGGIGTIRLRPLKIDGEDCWLATALKGIECHGGIPLAIPDRIFRQAGVNWGDCVILEGCVRFLQDVGLHEPSSRVHHARPLIVFVDNLKGVLARESTNPIVITPVALFESIIHEAPSGDNYDIAQYTFVQCMAGADAELDAAVEWIEKYASRFRGRLITNFDEQRPVLADAPLSYQRLVAKTYDRTVIKHFTGNIIADRIDQIVQESVVTQNFGEIHMGHKIKVDGPAIINIDSVLQSVTQSIGASSGLDSAEKSKLDALVRSLKDDMDKLKASHADEIKEIAEALEKAVANATKPKEERKQSLLNLSAKGLKEAAKLVGEIAPNILTTSGLIAKFIVGL